MGKQLSSSSSSPQPTATSSMSLSLQRVRRTRMSEESSNETRREISRMMHQQRSFSPSLLNEVRELTALMLQDHDELFHSSTIYTTNSNTNYSLSSILTEALELSKDLEREIQLLDENDEQ